MHMRLPNSELAIVEKAKIAADASIEVATINAAAKGDSDELKGAVQMMLAKMDKAHQDDAAQKAEQAAKPEPEAAAPVADIAEILDRLGEAMNRPRMKRMSITAPSGAVYHGEVEDVAEPESETL